MSSLFLIIVAFCAQCHLQSSLSSSVYIKPGFPSHHSLAQDIEHSTTSSSTLLQSRNANSLLLIRRSITRSRLATIEEDEEEGFNESSTAPVHIGPSSNFQDDAFTPEAEQRFEEQTSSHCSEISDPQKAAREIRCKYPTLYKAWKESIPSDELDNAMNNLETMQKTGFFRIRPWMDEGLDVSRMLQIINFRINGIKLRYIDKPIDQVTLSEQTKIVKLFSGLETVEGNCGKTLIRKKEYVELLKYDQGIQDDFEKFIEIAGKKFTQRVRIKAVSNLKNFSDDFGAALIMFERFRKMRNL